MKEWITVVITRELKALRREIESYPSESDLWEVRPGITNPGATSRSTSPAISSTSSATCSARTLCA